MDIRYAYPTSQQLESSQNCDLNPSRERNSKPFSLFYCQIRAALTIKTVYLLFIKSR